MSSLALWTAFARFFLAVLSFVVFDLNLFGRNDMALSRASISGVRVSECNWNHPGWAFCFFGSIFSAVFLIASLRETLSSAQTDSTPLQKFAATLELASWEKSSWLNLGCLLFFFSLICNLILHLIGRCSLYSTVMPASITVLQEPRLVKKWSRGWRNLPLGCLHVP